ncbi:MAG: hypothetical protein ACYS26_05380 [Planctomycetota bacterium]|jgi:hypothetical protein
MNHYDFFLFTKLVDVRFPNNKDSYDELYDTLSMAYNSFLSSKYNDFDKGVYECIEEYLEDEDLPFRQCTKTGSYIVEGYMVNHNLMSYGDIEYYASEEDLVERLKETYPEISDKEELLATAYEDEYYCWTQFNN